MSTNVTHEIKGDKLILTIDVSKKVVDNAPKSASGKTRVIGSTHGFLKVNDNISVGLNVTTK